MATSLAALSTRVASCSPVKRWARLRAPHPRLSGINLTPARDRAADRPSFIAQSWIAPCPAAARWARTSPADRALVLNRIADRMEANLEELALAETWDNGKPIRETLAADVPLAVDHFRCFARCIRAQEGSLSEVDEHTVAYHFHEPLGVVGQ